MMVYIYILLSMFCKLRNYQSKFVQGIQVTATTPTLIAVRLKTNAINIDVSNCQPSGSSCEEPEPQENDHDTCRSSSQRLLISVQLNVSLVLGTMIRDTKTDESDIQHLASFETQVALRDGIPVSGISSWQICGGFLVTFKLTVM